MKKVMLGGKQVTFRTKISKSKQELARIISENGGWCDGAEWAAQDRVVAFFSGGKPKYESYDKTWCANCDDGAFIVAMSVNGKIDGFHNTILSRAEYFHLYPETDADGWIEWLSDELPVAKGTIIDVKYSDGDELHGAPCGVETENLISIRGDGAGAELFGHSCFGPYIIAYRLHKPEQANPEFCESVMRSIPEPEVKPTIEQLAADYRNAKDYAERKQEEADYVKADADAKLKALEIAGEAIGLLVSPITTKQEPELVITDWRDLRPGDVITCIGEGWMESFEGRDAVVMEIETNYYEGYHCIMASMNGIIDWGGDFKFIRRP